MFLPVLQAAGKLRAKAKKGKARGAALGLEVELGPEAREARRQEAERELLRMVEEEERQRGAQQGKGGGKGPKAKKKGGCPPCVGLGRAPCMAQHFLSHVGLGPASTLCRWGLAGEVWSSGAGGTQGL